MFMCLECHKEDEKKYHCSHISVSRGKCELCDKVADCVDCRAYKQDTNLSKSYNICTDMRMNDALISCEQSHSMCDDCTREMAEHAGGIKVEQYRDGDDPIED